MSENELTYAREYDTVEDSFLMRKRGHLIACVVRNRVDVLKDLIDSQRWYTTRDKDGYTLLQIAIMNDSVEAFDYLISLPDYPLEAINKYGHTALAVALESCGYGRSEHFAYELIRKGVQIDNFCSEDDTPLHRALLLSFYKTAQLLVQKGVDVNLPNRYGRRPMDMALTMCYDIRETVASLLAHGAQPSFYHFEWSVMHNLPVEVQEALFLYIFDQYSHTQLRLDVLLKLAENNSALFYQIMECPIAITVLDDTTYPYFCMLCSVKTDCLRRIIQKFGRYLIEIFSRPEFSKTIIVRDRVSAVYLENLNVMFDSELKDTVINFICNLNSRAILQDLLSCGYTEVLITQLFCLLLSYGLNLEELVFQIVYNKFGYCQLFKILLHMDVQVGMRSYIKNIMPVFIYDVTLNLEEFLRTRHLYYVDSIDELLRYFVHPKLNEMCRRGDDTCCVSIRTHKVPLLIELARNVFRQFFIETFQIKTCKEFHAVLNGLPVSKILKEIITYKTKLY